MRHVADIPVDSAGNEGEIAALALLRRGASRGGQLDAPREISTFHNQGAGSPLRVSRMRHYILGRPLDWDFADKRPDLPGGGLRLPCEDDGPRRYGTPQSLSAREAVTLGDAFDRCASDPAEISVESHANSSARQKKRALVDSVGENMHSANFLGEVPEQREARRAS